jgi:hypothetical protein
LFTTTTADDSSNERAVQLINFKEMSQSTVSKLIDAVSKISGVSLIASQDAASTSKKKTDAGKSASSFLSSLFPKGKDQSDANGNEIVTIDLRNNKLLNGDDGFVSSLTKSDSIQLGSLSQRSFDS